MGGAVSFNTRIWIKGTSSQRDAKRKLIISQKLVISRGYRLMCYTMEAMWT